MIIDDPRILVDKSDAICAHALSTLLNYVVALNLGTDTVKLGLSKDNNVYRHCVDLRKTYTNVGAVIF
jgi:uncharacterized repeat protein (TIGR04076 family)